MRHWKYVHGTFSGKDLKPNFGEVSKKKTYLRQLNLCNATFGLCNHVVDYTAHKHIRKSSCKKCLAVAQDLFDENIPFRDPFPEEIQPIKSAFIEQNQGLGTFKTIEKGLKSFRDRNHIDTGLVKI